MTDNRGNGILDWITLVHKVEFTIFSRFSLIETDLMMFPVVILFLHTQDSLSLLDGSRLEDDLENMRWFFKKEVI